MCGLFRIPSNACDASFGRSVYDRPRPIILNDYFSGGVEQAFSQGFYFTENVKSFPGFNRESI